MSFTLPALAYGYDALEPHIDARTMQIHHDRHHKAYVDGLNAALKGHTIDVEHTTVEQLVSKLHEVPLEMRTAVRNHGGGHANHSLFWMILSPDGGGRPEGELAQAIDENLGGFEALQEELTRVAMNRFGSGWAWLSLDARKKLLVESTPNQDTPLMFGDQPLLCIDVWEHAYYLKHQNRRADYLEALFHVIDWSVVSQRYLAAMRGEPVAVGT